MIAFLPRRLRPARHRLAGLLVLLAAISSAWSQPVTPTPSASPVPTPIPNAEIVTASEIDLGLISTLGGALTSDNSAGEIDKNLQEITGEITRRTKDAEQRLRSSRTVSNLQVETANWTILRDTLRSQDRIVRDRLGRLDLEIQRLADLDARWSATAKTSAGSSLPGDILRRIQTVLSRAAAQRKALQASQNIFWSLQARIAEQDARIAQVLAAIAQARSAAWDRLFVRDSLPLWDLAAATPADQPAEAARSGLRDQFQALLAYGSQQRGNVALHLLLWAGLVGTFRWARRKAHVWVDADPVLARSTRIFDLPISAASIAAICLTVPLYPNAPAFLFIVSGILLIIPLVIVVRNLIDPVLIPLAWALALFYFAELAREATVAIPVLPRLIYLGETVVAAAFAVWLITLSRFSAKSAPDQARLWSRVRLGARLALLANVAATGANLFGYYNASLFLGQLILTSAYLAVLLYVGSRIAEGLTTFALNVPPLSLLRLVQLHRPMIERWLARLFRLTALAVWVLLTLEQMALRQRVVHAVTTLLTVQLRLGPVSAADLLAAGLTIWAAFLLSRFLRFILEEDIYSHTRIGAGASFAISTLLHYVIIFAGFYLALALLVGDMTKLTILASAFSVGVGFGLQNAANNFFSGLIVLFERPIKIGDVVQIGSDIGTVTRIGIRATVINTPVGSEIIVPNAKLIADPVTNWTLSDRHRRMEISLGVPSTADPQRVIDLLVKIARRHPRVRQAPAPRAFLTKIGSGVLSFDLHAWTDEGEDWADLRNDLTLALHTELARLDISPV